VVNLLLIVNREARVDVTVAEWDYTQQYPTTASEPTEDSSPQNPQIGTAGPNGTLSSTGPTFYYDVGAEGQLTVHM
jgi:hypothetical protein